MIALALSSQPLLAPLLNLDALRSSRLEKIQSSFRALKARGGVE